MTTTATPATTVNKVTRTRFTRGSFSRYATEIADTLSAGLKLSVDRCSVNAHTEIDTERFPNTLWKI